jgi:5-bromo-4-chloroindolyl phosphate hydrolysis protein
LRNLVGVLVGILVGILGGILVRILVGILVLIWSSVGVFCGTNSNYQPPQHDFWAKGICDIIQIGLVDV